MVAVVDAVAPDRMGPNEPCSSLSIPVPDAPVTVRVMVLLSGFSIKRPPSPSGLTVAPLASMTLASVTPIVREPPRLSRMMPPLSATPPEVACPMSAKFCVIEVAEEEVVIEGGNIPVVVH